jgi:hypothetical protein
MEKANALYQNVRGNFYGQSIPMKIDRCESCEFLIIKSLINNSRNSRNAILDDIS